MQPSKETIVELIGALAMLTEPSGKLNARISCAFAHPTLRPAEPDDFGVKYGYHESYIKVEHGFPRANNYTGSLDNAHALVDRWLPGCGWIAECGRLTPAEPLYAYSIFDSLDDVDGADNPIGRGEHDLAPVAFLIAAFNALLDQLEGGRDAAE